MKPVEIAIEEADSGWKITASTRLWVHRERTQSKIIRPGAISIPQLRATLQSLSTKDRGGNAIIVNHPVFGDLISTTCNGVDDMLADAIMILEREGVRVYEGE